VRRTRPAAPIVRVAAAIVALVLIACAGDAHDIPADVKINAFLKPAGDRIELIVRLPLASLIDADFPVRAGGFLDLPRADQVIRDGIKVWLSDNIDVYENGALLTKPRLAAEMVSLPSDRSFTSYDEARAHALGPPLPPDLDIYWTQQLLDVLLVYDIRSDRSDFSIDMRVERLGSAVTTALRFMPPGGAVRPFEWHGDAGLIYLDPSLSQAVLRFVVEGFQHILGGTDHLLFLACLVIPFRRLRPLIVIATSFTIAHSITLIASAFGYAPDALWFPPLIEFLIAVTIVYMALENIVGSNISRRWIMAFAFGLVHGFGFSFALREQLQFAGDHLVSSLLGFNLGVEIGQLAVLAVLVPALNLLFRYAVPKRLGIIILSALVTHTAWHWMLERWDQLTKFPLPKLDAALIASLMRGGLAVLILVAIVWLLSGVIRRFLSPKDAVPQKNMVPEKALVKSPAPKHR
jgi:hypothetical protein